MSSEVQRVVVVIQDASRDVSLNEIRWALKGLSLKPGDVIPLLEFFTRIITLVRYLSLDLGNSVTASAFLFLSSS